LNFFFFFTNTLQLNDSFSNNIHEKIKEFGVVISWWLQQLGPRGKLQYSTYWCGGDSWHVESYSTPLAKQQHWKNKIAHAVLSETIKIKPWLTITGSTRWHYCSLLDRSSLCALAFRNNQYQAMAHDNTISQACTAIWLQQLDPRVNIIEVHALSLLFCLEPFFSLFIFMF